MLSSYWPSRNRDQPAQCLCRSARGPTFRILRPPFPFSLSPSLPFLTFVFLPGPVVLPACQRPAWREPPCESGYDSASYPITMSSTHVNFRAKC